MEAYLAGRMHAAVPMYARGAIIKKPFTHILCDELFLSNFKKSAILWATNDDKKTWDKLSRAYKTPASSPLHVIRAGSHMPGSVSAYDDVEAYIDGHILGHAWIRPDGVDFVHLEYDGDLFKITNKDTIKWADDVLYDPACEHLVETTREPIVKKKPLILGL